MIDEHKRENSCRTSQNRYQIIRVPNMASSRHMFTTIIKDGKLDEYRKYHDEIWPEVAAGLRTCGVTQLTIFLVPDDSRRLIMYITTAGAIDLGKATGPGSKYREDPKCKEWEDLMDADFHGGWTVCTEIHSSDKQWNVSLGLG